MKIKLITISFIAIFSIILWVFVSFSGEHSATITIPVNVTNIPEGYSLNYLSNPDITITVKGEGWQLAQLSFGPNPNLSIPVDGEKKGQTVSVRNALGQSSLLSSSMLVTAVEPEQLKFSIEKIHSKTVNIIHNISLDFKPGYNLITDISVLPDIVVILGPRSIIDSIEVVRTEFVKFDDINAVVSREVKLDEIKNVEFNIENCLIEFDVQKIVDKTFKNLVIETRGVPSSKELSLYPEQVNVILRGGISSLSKLSADEIKPFIYFKQALDDTLGYIEPHVNVPEFTNLVDIRPIKIEYIIKQY